MFIICAFVIKHPSFIFITETKTNQESLVKGEVFEELSANLEAIKEKIILLVAYYLSSMIGTIIFICMYTCTCTCRQTLMCVQYMNFYINCTRASPII